MKARGLKLTLCSYCFDDYAYCSLSGSRVDEKAMLFIRITYFLRMIICCSAELKGVLERTTRYVLFCTLSGGC